MTRSGWVACTASRKVGSPGSALVDTFHGPPATPFNAAIRSLINALRLSTLASRVSLRTISGGA